MQKKTAIKKYLKTCGGDGHTIVRPQFLVEMGFTTEFVGKYTRNHVSGEDWKSTIFDTKTGNPFKECHGTYLLEFAWGLAKDVGADTSEAASKLGRGFQAQCLASAIAEAIKE